MSISSRHDFWSGNGKVVLIGFTVFIMKKKG